MGDYIVFADSFTTIKSAESQVVSVKSVLGLFIVLHLLNNNPLITSFDPKCDVLMHHQSKKKRKRITLADFHKDLNQGHFHQNIEVLPLELKMEDVGKRKWEKAGPSEGFAPMISEYIV